MDWMINPHVENLSSDQPDAIYVLLELSRVNVKHWCYVCVLCQHF